jgi:predicted transporter
MINKNIPNESNMNGVANSLSTGLTNVFNKPNTIAAHKMSVGLVYLTPGISIVATQTEKDKNNQRIKIPIMQLILAETDLFYSGFVISCLRKPITID